MKVELKYFGIKPTILVIRDFILNSKLKDGSTILLHPNNFDEMVIEYRDFYEHSINDPYILLGIEIAEDTLNKVPENRIGIIIDDMGVGSSTAS